MEELTPARHDAIRILTRAVGEDRMSIEQFESRLALVHQAPNRASLEAIIADLLPTGDYAAALPAPRAAPLPGPGEFAGPVEPAERMRLATFFGSTKRAGSWTVPLRLELKATLGEIVIDMRDAAFLSDVVEIHVEAVLSTVTLIVPAGAQVENEVEERFSSSTHSTRSARGVSPLDLLIRITGRVLFTSLEVKEKRPSAEDAQRPLLDRLLG